MSAIVHGWCGYVEKSNNVVFQQMVLNKLWIPDVLIDIIKDYMYITTEEVLRKYYKLHLNQHINDLVGSMRFLQDIYGRRRIAVWIIQTKTCSEIHLQGGICVECGSYCTFHDTLTGCCPLEWDIEGEAQVLYDEETAIEEEDDDDEEWIPEVTWDINIPTEQPADTFHQQVKDQIIEDGFQQAIADALSDPYLHEDFDYESQMADYAEYLRELEMERRNSNIDR